MRHSPKLGTLFVLTAVATLKGVDRVNSQEAHRAAMAQEVNQQPTRDTSRGSRANSESKGELGEQRQQGSKGLRFTARLRKPRLSIRRRVLAAIAATVVVGTWSTTATAAPADVGVGITAAPIVLGKSAQPGATYELGPLTVVNTGTELAVIRVRVAEERGGNLLPVPADWVSFDRETVTVGAGDSAAITLQIAIPAGARVGEYRSLLIAGLSADPAPRGNRIGAEAATSLQLTVEGSAARAGVDPRTRLLISVPAAALAALVIARLLAYRQSKPNFTRRRT